ncbi:MAG: methylated-DNA--[protein]-cysteine S-methyltransferase [Candidatus Glassbacteria bacterium]
MEKELSYAVYESPLGWLILTHSGAGLSRLDLSPHGPDRARDFQRQGLEKRFGPVHLVRDETRLKEALAWLDRYFDNPQKSLPYRGKFDAGGTVFQRKVWLHLAQIPSGHTETYGQVAREVGRPAASRAVGQACGANPIPLIVPCHRVVAAGGGLGGFGLGLDLKRRMLKLEGRRPGK